MRYPVIVRTTSPTQYEAEPIGLPELRTSAATEDAAVTDVRQALVHWFSTVKIVHVEVPETTDHPWLRAFGRSADDPDFDELQAELVRVRHDANAV